MTTTRLALPVLLLILICCAKTKNELRAADINQSFSVPVLLVLPNSSGTSAQLTFGLSRKADSRAPLAIAITEDTPGGAGESIRASMWLAAMVAALDRMDDLSGIRISLELPGQVDGPSAGAALCLAILSAMDGKEFPTDCGITGAIMPDGTIGAVGGIAEKIKAAGKAGIKRMIVPAFSRFEADLKTGQDVDLKRLAESLKMEFIPVENISQAYSVAHRVHPPAAKSFDRHTLDIPEATEEVLKQLYEEHSKAGMNIWNAITDDDKQLIAEDTFSTLLFIAPQNAAEKAHRAGRLLYATEKMRSWRILLEARKNLLATIKPDLFKPGDVKGNLEQLNQLLQQITKTLMEGRTLILASQKVIPESAAQLCDGYYEMYGILGMNQIFQNAIDESIAELDKADQKEEVRSELAQAGLGFKVLQLLVAHSILEETKYCVAEDQKVAGTFPKRQLPSDASAIERLFHSASLAAHGTFMSDVVGTYSSLLEMTDAQTIAIMKTRDWSLAMYLPVARESEILHRELIGWQDLQSQRFATASAAHIQASNLAAVSGLITRWNQLEIAFDENDQIRYGRTEQLSYLLTAARDNALRTIAECKSHDIPCIRPIYYFEAAEMTRDDPDEDKVEVLTNYWNASLQAKVLMMLFAETPTTR